MLSRLLHQTRSIRRLAVAAIAVAAVLLVANIPRVLHGHDGRAEEAISEATEHFGRTLHASGDGPDVLGPAMPAAVIVLAPVAAPAGAQLPTAVVAAPHAARSTAAAPRAPPVRA